MEEIPTPGGSPMPSSDVSPVIQEELATEVGIDEAVPSHEYVTPGKDSSVEEPGKQVMSPRVQAAQDEEAKANEEAKAKDEQQTQRDPAKSDMNGKTKKCWYCQELLSEKQKFCGDCGKNQEQKVCKKCSHFSNPKAKYCEDCGEPFEKVEERDQGPQSNEQRSASPPKHPATGFTRRVRGNLQARFEQADAERYLLTPEQGTPQGEPRAQGRTQGFQEEEEEWNPEDEEYDQYYYDEEDYMGYEAFEEAHATAASARFPGPQEKDFFKDNVSDTGKSDISVLDWHFEKMGAAAEKMSKAADMLKTTSNDQDRINNKDVKLDHFVIGPLGERALDLSNWLKSEGSKFAMISDEAEAYWNLNLEQAKEAYSRYVIARPLEKMDIKPIADTDPKWKRIRPVAGPLIRQAIPKDIKDYLVLNGDMSMSHAMFELMKK